FNHSNIGWEAISWGSSAPGVATVAGNGNTSFPGGGSATITATFIDARWQYNFDYNTCDEDWPDYYATSPVTVQIPTSDRIDHQISAFVPTNCPAGQSGYFRKVQK